MALVSPKARSETGIRGARRLTRRPRQPVFDHAAMQHGLPEYYALELFGHGRALWLRHYFATTRQVHKIAFHNSFYQTFRPRVGLIEDCAQHQEARSRSRP